MSFGLKNAPATFQRFIHEVLRGLDFIFPYLDDILIASKSNQEHEIHLNLVLERLNTFGLRIYISKSVFAVEEIEFLGYLITPQEYRPLPDKVQAIMNYKRPENIQDLRTFLGILNFYCRYLKIASKNQALLHEYLKGPKKDKRKIQWTDEAEKQFEKGKNDLANATLLSFPNS
ncbi:Transposon Ty3-I Gag-Pol polyprotein [Araneus ventricosus]|uniref:Transposon Ty3-I Gag-Pol polyprotein n=1 Tax=Araneus ventricosus TaxID=182803 RepID=A0A4Y2MJ22_ARAVE|nr:Transposon Ty3-I Gag-Pol polyprotein [Araneus ventricosus]